MFGTATAPKANENDIEVFARTVPEIVGERCDSCGGTVTARYQASKGNLNLFFCGHHIRKQADSLRDKGFNITPEDTSFTAAFAE